MSNERDDVRTGIAGLDQTLRSGLRRGALHLVEAGLQRGIRHWFVRVSALLGSIRSALASHRQCEDARAIDNRDRVLAVFGHELRNLVTTSRLAVELLDRGQVGRARSILDRQLDNLTRIVDDLLDIGRTVRGAVVLQREPLDVREVITGLRDAAEVKVRKHGLELSVTLGPDPIPIMGDATRIEQVAVNLIDNAIKYSDPGDKIELRAVRNGSHAELVVADTGQGIPHGELESIFEMFARLRPDERPATQGLGIGLSLAREIVQLHGGTIEAHSAGCGRGSTFTVLLPTTRQRVAQRSEATGCGPAVMARHVLVVDDIADLRQLLGELVSARGFEVTEAESGEEALELLAKQQFDAAIVDIGLPDIDGLEVAATARERGCTARMIALSGHGQPSDRDRALAAGFDTHVTKPVSADALARVLRGGD